MTTEQITIDQRPAGEPDVIDHRVRQLDYDPADPVMRGWLAASGLDPDAIAPGASVSVRTGEYLHVGEEIRVLGAPLPDALGGAVTDYVEVEARFADGTRFFQREVLPLGADDAAARVRHATRKVRHGIDLHYAPPCAVPGGVHGSFGKGVVTFTPERAGGLDGLSYGPGDEILMCATHYAFAATGGE